MEDIIFLKKSELEAVVSAAITKVLAETKPQPKRTLSMNEAISYLNENGCLISKSTLYKHTMEGTIPFRRWGERKIVFDRVELDGWIERRTKKIG